MVEIFQNIRQLYTFTLPCEELAMHVEFFSESDAKSTLEHAADQPFSVKMFSSWTPTFYLNLGSPYLIFSGGKWHSIQKGQDLLLLRDSTVERLNQPADNIFTVKFYPGGLKAVLGIDQTKCINKLVELNNILPAKLLAQLKQPLTFEERTKLMQDYLLSQFKKNTQNDHFLQIVNQAIGEYTANGMQLNTDKVAEKVFVTSKSINRYFHRVVGVSPKTYFSVLRARTALTAYINYRENFSPQTYGYYDPSHFGKKIYQFTGTKLRSI